jgi:hypothetical protein
MTQDELLSVMAAIIFASWGVASTDAEEFAVQRARSIAQRVARRHNTPLKQEPQP